MNKTYTALPFTLSDFDFDLPEALIAQTPAPERTQSRLLRVLDKNHVTDNIFADIIQDFQAGDVMVINNTKVIPARLFGQKPSGGKVEVFVERILSANTALCMVRANRSPKVGSKIIVAEHSANIIARQEIFFVIELHEGNWTDLTTTQGDIPLPPYIARETSQADLSRYQTVYASKTGAVAAPTAGLHFDQTLLQQLTNKGVILTEVTLHVGAGTFLPVKHENLDEHDMHFELFEIPESTRNAVNQAKVDGRHITAVGTTSLRALESAAKNGQIVLPGGDTNLFIRPGYPFEIVDRLITNFHLPKSSLMMLVSAFAGYESIHHAYVHAIANQYRFFSYGDAMLLTRSI